MADAEVIMVDQFVKYVKGLVTLEMFVTTKPLYLFNGLVLVCKDAILLAMHEAVKYLEKEILLRNIILNLKISFLT